MQYFRLNYLLNKGNLSALQFKITNLICHIICCILLCNVYEHIVHGKSKPIQDIGPTKKSNVPQPSKTKKWWMDVPYLSTLLFAVHPVHVEAVCGIVGRADLLAAMTFFLAFLCYSKSMTNQKWSYIYVLCTVILSAISMLCKENGVTVLVCTCFSLSPLDCFVYDINK